MSDNHSKQQRQPSVTFTATTSRTRQNTAATTSAIRHILKRRTRQKWERNEMDAMLAWIFKNKDKWLESKKEAIKIIQANVLKSHTLKSITSKIYELQHTFEACFEFASYVHNNQESEPKRHVIRERVLNFDLYKECRAAFGPPEYDAMKFKVVRKIQGTPPTPQPRPRPRQQERSSILKFTPVGYVTEVYIP